MAAYFPKWQLVFLSDFMHDYTPLCGFYFLVQVEMIPVNLVIIVLSLDYTRL